MILTVKASIITILLSLRLPLGIVFRSKVNHLYPIFCPDLIRGINRLSKHSHVDQIFGAWLLREMHHCQIDSEIPLYFPPCAVRVIFAVIHVKIGAHLPSISKKLNLVIDGKNIWYPRIIDGHGVGVWGCAHPPKNLKSPDTPPCRRQGGCAPWCQRPRRKIFHAHPGGSIFSHFLAKSPRCLLNKPPNKKIIWHPCARAAAKIFWPPKAAENFFWTHPVCTHPPWPKTRAHLCCTWMFHSCLRNFHF